MGSRKGLAYLLVALEDRVCVGLLRHLRRLNVLHALDVFGEIALQRSIDGRIVNGDERGYGAGRSQRDGHGGFGSPCGLYGLDLVRWRIVGGKTYMECPIRTH